MKKIKSTYFLIFAVVLIWVVIVVRLISLKKDESDDNMVNRIHEVRISEEPLVKEKLNLSYRDPFLQRNGLKKRNTKNDIKKSFIKIKPEWPRLVYCGFVTDKVTGVKNINIKVGNGSYLARTNQVIEDVLIKKIAKDSIELEFRGVSKIVYIK